MRHHLIMIFVLALLAHPELIAQKRKKKKEQKIQSVIRQVESYKGTPYRYGGNSRKGIDCSALIQNCFSYAGYKIPRTAKEQSKFGKKVGWKSLKPGDVVFFKFKQKGEKWFVLHP